VRVFRDDTDLTASPGCVLRPAVAYERVELRSDGLVRITLKKSYAGGTIAVDMDPLSLLCRLARSVPHRAGTPLATEECWPQASPSTRHLAPMAPSETPADGQRPRWPERTRSYRPWAELLALSFAIDVLACPKCHGRMSLLAMVQDPANVARFLAAWARRPRCPVGAQRELERTSRRNRRKGVRANESSSPKSQLSTVSEMHEGSRGRSGWGSAGDYAVVRQNLVRRLD
jgi:hypothetical protein